MYLNDKLSKNADLVVPFIECPIGEAIPDCPFVSFWKEADIGKRVKQMENISDEDLNQLRIFHQSCLLKKLEQIQE